MSIPADCEEPEGTIITNMGDENLSEDFEEILQKSNLNEKAKDARAQGQAQRDLANVSQTDVISQNAALKERHLKQGTGRPGTQCNRHSQVWHWLLAALLVAAP